MDKGRRRRLLPAAMQGPHVHRHKTSLSTDAGAVALDTHALMRWLLALFDGFATRTGLGADETIILVSLMMIAHADHLRTGSSIWISRASLGTLSQLTAIPKETVRRKLKKMADLDLIELRNESAYWVNADNEVVRDLYSDFRIAAATG